MVFLWFLKINEKNFQDKVNFNKKIFYLKFKKKIIFIFPSYIIIIETYFIFGIIEKKCPK